MAHADSSTWEVCYGYCSCAPPVVLPLVHEKCLCGLLLTLVHEQCMYQHACVVSLAALHLRCLWSFCALSHLLLCSSLGCHYPTSYCDLAQHSQVESSVCVSLPACKRHPVCFPTVIECLSAAACRIQYSALPSMTALCLSACTAHLRGPHFANWATVPSMAQRLQVVSGSLHLHNVHHSATAAGVVYLQSHPMHWHEKQHAHCLSYCW